ncbi:hypothetical protein IQ224_13715 [Microcystis sp. LEGE 00066]|uniref:Uma5 n=2 Tax=Microcystis aeruginosa (strain PCC 7806) TaxID=267872 RepID=Q9RNA4_MICA7|nr:MULTISPECIES: hypothetical protein [Microcystis]TRT96459.1 MAG: hypothetical protein EWV61_20675 [Microcystis aeruginosa Ma_AC_P_19900807_S300]AAF00968.1 Uma5 [Microcystis aeruginosa PCC 7806]ARI82528.1 Uma5 [Microcystis aeruginosa PCC 7806SL]ELS46504.1 uma5 [Microcystis aeruginosa FACHB-905 = DIANCHI905]MBE9263185.1 hypothetical protein [Microcystis sp. LEGE 00066]
MSNKNKFGFGLGFDLVEDFVVDKAQDSPDNYAAKGDINQMEADNITDEGDIVNIDADNVTKDGDNINIDDIKIEADNIAQEGDIIEGDQNNYYISISSCQPESDSPSEVEAEQDSIVNDAPLPDAKDLEIESPPEPEFDFEIGG